MLIGYMRVSKADGSQATDLQRDALTAAGVDPYQLYEDQASGKREDRHTKNLQTQASPQKNSNQALISGKIMR
jgi:DNA invertase Pin-like site-specific DNA recombinase